MNAEGYVCWEGVRYGRAAEVLDAGHGHGHG